MKILTIAEASQPQQPGETEAEYAGRHAYAYVAVPPQRGTTETAVNYGDYVLERITQEPHLFRYWNHVFEFPKWLDGYVETLVTENIEED